MLLKKLKEIHRLDNVLKKITIFTTFQLKPLKHIKH